MPMMIRAFILGLTLLLLNGCSARFVFNDSGGRYSMAQDRAPSDPARAVNAPDVVPKYEPRSDHGNKSPYQVFGKTYHVMDDAKGFSQTGIASWYGAKFHGHTTSNGEIFDMYQVSAAHKNLPIPTYARVTNLDNGKSIIVRVNDRGPFHGDRIIDLSYAAAVKLDYHLKGVARVRVDVLDANETDTPQFFLQVASFSEQSSAIRMVTLLKDIVTEPIFIETAEFFRVKIGPLSHAKAQQLRQKLALADFGQPIVVSR